MKAFFFKILLVTFIFIVFSACQNKGKDYHLYSIEKEILQDPHKAYNYLDSIGKEIKDAPDSTQMFYQILLCRAKDKCYIRHKSDSTMQNVVKYYKSRNDKEHLMQAYYCMGCINRDLQQADKALKYFHNALDCSKNSNKYELIAIAPAINGIATIALYKFDIFNLPKAYTAGTNADIDIAIAKLVTPKAKASFNEN